MKKLLKKLLTRPHRIPHRLYSEVSRAIRERKRMATVKRKHRESRFHEIWADALPEEVAFWDRWLANTSRPHDGPHVRTRSRDLAPDLLELLDADVGDAVRILDVGAGPLTSVGNLWEGRDVDVVPVDPLAEAYNQLLAKHQIEPLFTTIHCEGEKLSRRFPAEHFDLVHASNAIDHSYDPVEVIDQMLVVLKRGCCIYLYHCMNEAECSNYHMMHQWNFDACHGDFVIHNLATRTNVSDRLGSAADVSCEIRDGSWRSEEERVLVCRIRKK